MDKKTLNAKTVKELRALAAELGLPGRTKLRKAGLVEAILGVTAGQEAAAPPPREDVREDAPASAEPVAAEPVEEPAEEEPGEVFIDRGHVLAERYPGRRIRVMVRDPQTLYVYWETEEGAEGFEVVALDAAGGRLDRFAVGATGSGGYLRVPEGCRGRVEVRPVCGGEAGELLGSVEFGLPPAGVPPELSEERWVDTAVAPPRAVAAPVAGPRPGPLPQPQGPLPTSPGRPLSSPSLPFSARPGR